MLVLRHNELSSDQLIICERTMLKFIDDKFPAEETGMHFNVWKWSIPELYGIVLGMFVKLDLVGTLDIRKSEMLDFIIDVDKGYYNTSYHSFLHAVDVVVVLYYMLTDLGAAKYLSSLDAICLLISGLCHDIGHPGLNNVYQVNARTELAIRYNDQSVLENYSCDLTMDIITKHKLFRHVHKCNTDYLGCDPKEVNTSLKDLIKKTILATDMMFHFDLLESLHNMIESTSCSFSSEESGEETESSCSSSPASSLSSSPESSPITISPPKQFPISTSNSNSNTNTNNSHVKITRSFSRSSSSSVIVTLDSDQRELLLKILIHAADLSNTVRPWEISKLWSDRVVEEFFCQGDLEKENNFPVSPNMDREQSHQCQISLGFGDFVVKPYFEAFATFLIPATTFLDILAENRVFWDNMKNAPPIPEIVTPGSQSTTNSYHESSSSSSSSTITPKDDPSSSSKGQRRVSLAAGLLIIPEDIQEKLRSMTSSRSPRHRRLKRSLSGRSFSHHTLLPTPGSLIPDGGGGDDDGDYRKSTRRKSDGPNIILNSGSTSNNLSMSVISNELSVELSTTNGTSDSPTSPSSSSTMTACSHHQKRLHGRMRRSSSLDHNMIRQITALYGTGDTPTSEQRAVMAGS